MKTNFPSSAAAALLLLSALPCAGSAGLPAFPGAEGHGAGAVGGRGGRIIEVTNLKDAGPGSLRAALGASGPRTVVFRVGGVIELKSRIDIANPFMTVAGQTAPGGGILLKGSTEGGGQMLRIRTHDVVLRYLRIRSGTIGQPGKGQINVALDPLPAQGSRYGDIRNVVLDHLSLSWTLDENLAVFRNVPGGDAAARESYPTISGVTVQRCLIGEGLYPHSTGLQAGGERVAQAGRSIFNGGHGVSDLDIHHNLFANSSHRNPGLGCKSSRVINNVMYNWSSKCGETHDAIAVDWIGNYFRPGPLSAARGRLLVHNDFFKGHPDKRFRPPSIHLLHNVRDGEPAGWEDYVIHYSEEPVPESHRRAQPMSGPGITITSAAAAYESVLGDVGANARLDATGRLVPNADAVDQRIVDEVRRRRGEGTHVDGNRVHISDPVQVGGYPAIAAGEAYADSDHDGMADVWERARGLDSGDPSDAHGDADGDGYPNVEEFLNGTNPSKAE